MSVIDFKEYSELYHHGIKGQKWGERNGPPYPLDRQVSMKVTASAKDEEAKGVFNPRQIKTLSFHDNELNFAKKVFNYIEEAEERRYADGSSSFFSPAKCFSDIPPDERRSGKGDQGIARDWLLKSNETLSDSTKNCNPGYGELGTTNNCVRCAAALELRQRGMNVVAARALSGCSPFENETWFKGAKTKGYASMQEMMRDILKQGPGASGSLAGYYGNGLGSGAGGHTVHYKVEGRKITIQDGQNGKTYDNFSEFWKQIGFNTGGCFATRLDNCQPDFEAMSHDSVFGVNTPGRRGGNGDSFYDYDVWNKRNVRLTGARERGY
jgi:hypothetical protein